MVNETNTRQEPLSNVGPQGYAQEQDIRQQQQVSRQATTLERPAPAVLDQFSQRRGPASVAPPQSAPSFIPAVGLATSPRVPPVAPVIPAAAVASPSAVQAPTGRPTPNIPDAQRAYHANHAGNDVPVQSVGKGQDGKGIAAGAIDLRNPDVNKSGAKAAMEAQDRERKEALEKNERDATRDGALEKNEREAPRNRTSADPAAQALQASQDEEAKRRLGETSAPARRQKQD